MFIKYYIITVMLCYSEFVTGKYISTNKLVSDIISQSHIDETFASLDVQRLPYLQNSEQENNLDSMDSKVESIFKRDILLVDEDFDVDPADRANQMKSEVNKTDTPTILETTFEGSGDTEMQTSSSKFTTSETFNLTMPEKLKQVSRDDVEGSTDDVFQNSTIITESLTTKVTGSVPDYIPISCLNRPCESASDIDIQTNYKGNVPEGTNLTLTCSISNFTEESLYWYKSGNGIYSLEILDKNDILSLSIEDAKVNHSGVYKCVKWASDDNCCHKHLHLRIYEIPAYNYHLLTVGVVTLSCLVTCLLIKFWKDWTSKKYKTKKDIVKGPLLP